MKIDPRKICSVAFPFIGRHGGIVAVVGPVGFQQFCFGTVML